MEGDYSEESFEGEDSISTPKIQQQLPPGILFTYIAAFAFGYVYPLNISFSLRRKQPWIFE